MSEQIHIILDPGHANYDITKGKYSPILTTDEGWDDAVCCKGRFREGMFNRDIVKRLTNLLDNLGGKVVVHNVSPEDKEISLGTRVARANKICNEFGTKNCVFVSVHANAAGNGKDWLKARGLSVHCCHNCSSTSKRLAQNIYKAGKDKGYAGNRSVPKDMIWYNNFYVIKNTKCPAVLVENLFYDNKEDVKLLLDPKHREQIAEYIYMGICNTVLV